MCWLTEEAPGGHFAFAKVFSYGDRVGNQIFPRGEKSLATPLATCYT